MRTLILLFPQLLLFLFAAPPASASVVFTPGGDNNILENDSEKIFFSLSTGTITVQRGGTTFLTNGHAAGAFTACGIVDSQPATTSAYHRSVSSARFSDLLGEGTEMTMLCTGMAFTPDLQLTVRLYDARPGSVWLLTARNSGSCQVLVSHLIPLETLGTQGGGLFLGLDPGRHTVLDEGPFTALYFAALLDPSTLPTWSADSVAIQNLDGPSHLVAGYLTFFKALGSVQVQYQPGQAQKDPNSERMGFTRLTADCDYINAVPVSPGEALSSEWFYLAPFAQDGQHALEQYGKTVAQWLGKKPWTGQTPAGWNSWGRGTYGHDINESIILENMYFMRDNFERYGMGTYTLDDGWQQAYGDWEANSKFPHGMKWMADQIRAAGFQPGIWFTGMVCDKDSNLALTHPDWIGQYDILGQELGKGELTLDMTNPEVQQWLHNLTQKIAVQWGYSYLKSDYSYYAIFQQNRYDPVQTKIGGYINGLKILRAGLPADTFYMNIGPMGGSFAISEGLRTTLDNTAAWTTGGVDIGGEGLKPISQVNTRRYWINNNILVQNPDMIFFRNVTENESKCFLSQVAMGAEIVILGEKLVDMTPRQVDIIQRILPVVKDQGRPVDLFEKQYPEVWDLPIKRSFESWHVVGLFNWGAGWDFYHGLNLPEGPHTHDVDFLKLGMDVEKKYLAWEFWTEAYLGRFQGGMVHEDANHSVSLVVLREDLNRPQLLGYSRHFTGGAVDIEDVRWSPQDLTLTVDFQGVEDTSYRFYFHVPQGFAFQSASGSAPSLTTLQQNLGEVEEVTSQTPGSAGEYELVLTFTGGQVPAAVGAQHAAPVGIKKAVVR